MRETRDPSCRLSHGPARRAAAMAKKLEIVVAGKWPARAFALAQREQSSMSSWDVDRAKTGSLPPTDGVDRPRSQGDHAQDGVEGADAEKVNARTRKIRLHASHGIGDPLLWGMWTGFSHQP